MISFISFLIACCCFAPSTHPSSRCCYGFQLPTDIHREEPRMRRTKNTLLNSSVFLFVIYLLPEFLTRRQISFFQLVSTCLFTILRYFEIQISIFCHYRIKYALEVNLRAHAQTSWDVLVSGSTKQNVN